MTFSRSLLGALALTLLLTGCLPTSCRRTESRALFPSDSLSRALAETLPVDTLAVVAQTRGGDEHALEYPRTVQFGPDGHIYVADVERNSLFVFDGDGTFVREWATEAEFPYLAGVRGDSLVVYHPTVGRLHVQLGDSVVRRVEVPAVPGNNVLHYAAAADSALYVKQLGDEFTGYLARLDADGGIADSVHLPGPMWRRAGLLRTWGDSLLSLSGYRPVVDVWHDGRLDTMALAGFDSPMLARSRAYMTGEARDAPLLTAAAASAGDLLFVLNMRPGWLRVDAFGRDGRVRHLLVQPDPGFSKSFYPQDVAARRDGDGYHLAVVVTEPVPRLDVYRWRPGR